MSHPFGSSFESLSASPGPVVEAIHEQEFQQLLALLNAPAGQLISLRAPRAGYGKTTLLARLRDAQGPELLFIPIPLAEGRRFEGELILEEALNQLLEPTKAGGSVTFLDLLARKLFAKGLLPMVNSGEVPCHDQKAALASLQDRPVEAFDFHQEGAAIAHWAQQQFKLLGPRLSSALAKASRTPGRHTSAWVKILFDYATQVPGDPARADNLMTAVFGSQSSLGSRNSFLEVVGAFLNLVTYVKPVALVLDEVEGLSGDPGSALSVATHLASLWQAAPATKCILSVNDDIWYSAFVPNLPGGLQDRLEDNVVRLQALEASQAEALVIARSAGQSAKVMPRLILEGEGLYPRQVLKLARAAWDEVEPTTVTGTSTTVLPEKSLPDVAPAQLKSEPVAPAYPPKQVARVRLPITSPPPVYQFAPAYPPKQVARVRLPIVSAPPVYKVSVSYPPKFVTPTKVPVRKTPPVYRVSYPPKVVPVKVPIVKAPPIYLVRSAYPPKVAPIKPPLFKGAVVYKEQAIKRAASPVSLDSSYIPTPLPIKGEGFAGDFAAYAETTKVSLSSRPKVAPPVSKGEESLTRTYPPKKVPALTPPLAKSPPLYLNTPKPEPVDSPFVIAPDTKKTRWVAQKAKLPPQPKIEAPPFAEL